MRVFVLIRAIVYATCFIAFLLIFVPTRLLDRSGIARPPGMGVPELLGATAATVGALLALWCIFTFVFVGRGIPAPFDPPRRLVVRGPYRFVRNPMYLGHIIFLIGLTLILRSVFAAILTVAVATWFHIRVCRDEKRLLLRLGEPYERYLRSVERWLTGLF